jgi:isoquinoline 1-oxidoreductase beta subunit
VISLTVNGAPHTLDLDPDTPLLWVLRDHLGLTGAKYGCGAGRCGACTVHLGGEAVRSCTIPLGRAAGRPVVTIEGLGGGRLHPVQRAWVLEDVSQCGYCQPGQIMAAAALLTRHPEPTQAQVDDALRGVLCRCGTYRRIRRAIRLAGELLRTGQEPDLPPVPALGAGLVRGGASRSAQATELNPWVAIEPDGTAVVRVDKAEMGQGVLTTLAAAVAGELGVAWHAVRVEPAPCDAAYEDPVMGEQLTGGSTSTRFSWERMRQAGARARAALVAAAAKAWAVPHAECEAAQGRIVHRPTGRALGYAAAAALPTIPPGQSPVPTLGDPVAPGVSLPRADALPKARGAALFGLDSRPRGALVAAVARCPAHGGARKSFDPAEARRVPGVRAVVAVPTGVAVAAETTWAALRGREALKVSWEPGALADLDDGEVERRLEAALEEPGLAAEERGDVRAALSPGGPFLEAAYRVPFLAHAPLEPMNASAAQTAAGWEIRAPTQAQTAVRAAAARALGVSPEAVAVQTPFLGGGFGRRLQADYAAEAAAVARALGAPVQVVWTRGDDLAHDAYRPPALHRLRAALGPDGLPSAWLHRIATPSIRGLPARGSALDPSAVEGAVHLPYALPHRRVEWCPVELGVPLGYWRSVGHSHTAFAVESFLDELAQAARVDPLEYRLRLLEGAPRHRAVVELAAARADWGKDLPRGWGRGIALHESFGSIVAHVAEVERRAGSFFVRRLVCAADCGRVANPAGAVAQLEGGSLFGLSAALYEDVSFRQGAAVPRNFGEYRILSLPEAPEVEVHLVPSREEPGGAGEPGVPPVAPAVANALRAASGLRARELPLRKGV